MLSKLLQNKRNRIFLMIAGLVVVAGAGLLVYRLFIYKAPVETGTEEALQTVTVKRGDLEIAASGTGSYVAASTADIGFEASGQLTDISIKIGDRVEKGQVLASLENSSAQTTYNQARRTLLNMTSVASVAAAEEAVATAEDTVETEKQTLLYIISPTVYNYEVKLAEAQQALEKANAADAAGSNDETKAAVATAETAVKKAETNVEKGWYWYRNEYVPDMFTVEEHTPGSRKITKYVAAPSEADISAARSGLTLAEANLQEARYYLAALKGEEIPADATGSALAEFEQAKLDLQTAEDELNALVLVAPISGLVTAVDADPGDTVTAGSPIITISDVTKVYLDFYLDETDFDKVATGYPVKVVFDSLPDLTFEGEVTSIDPSLTDQNGTKLISGTAVLTSISPEVQKTLLLGMSAAVDVIGGSATDALLLSVDALHEIDTGQYGVYVLNDGTLEFTIVEVGLKDSFYAEILDGLNPGDVVSTGLLETK